ncbi:MAG: hypothetical protein H0V29_05195 [Thermoleophilaceae bacterium]|nr:hypothetical protein [Thermoleophilaceae bacterium]
MVAIALVAGGGSGDATGGERKATQPKLGRPFSNASAGIEGRVPRGWSARRARGAIRLRSRDRTTAVSLSSPAPARHGGRILGDSLAAIRAGYDRVSASEPAALKLGGLRARSVRVSAVSKQGTRLTALVTTARGKRRAYLVEVFSAVGAPVRRLVEAQRVLNELKLRK